MALYKCMSEAQIESFKEERRDDIAYWILSGRRFFLDDIIVVGDLVFITVYLPELL